jgi:hypothetical protein
MPASNRTPSGVSSGDCPHQPQTLNRINRSMSAPAQTLPANSTPQRHSELSEEASGHAEPINHCSRHKRTNIPIIRRTFACERCHPLQQDQRESEANRIVTDAGRLNRPPNRPKHTQHRQKNERTNEARKRVSNQSGIQLRAQDSKRCVSQNPRAHPKNGTPKPM